MSEDKKITWNDSVVENLFADSEFKSFTDFSEITTDSDTISTQLMREHKCKKYGEVNRRMTRIEIGGKVFFLKQARNDAYINIVNEFNAIEILPDFDLIPSEIVAFLLDSEKKLGFILLSELKGYYSVKELIEGNASEEAIEDFAKRKEVILKRVAERIRSVHKKGYAYPDWFAKHIYIKQESDDIVLIDLERFRPLDKCPWYFSSPITSIFVKNKFWRKLRKSLKSEMFDDSVLNRILHE